MFSLNPRSFDPSIVSTVTVITVMTMCGDWTWVCGDRGTMVARCNVVNDGDLAEFVSFTGLILLNIGGGEHYDSDRILTTPAPKLEEL